MKNRLLAIFMSIVLVFTFVITNYKIACANDVILNEDIENYEIQQDKIFDFFESINHEDWQKWLNYHSPSVKNIYTQFLQNIDNQSNSRGIFNVKHADVVDIQKINNDFAPKVPELSEYYSNNERYKTFLVTLDLQVKNENRYFHNGLNYKLMIMVNDESQWNVGLLSGVPEGYEEILAEEGKQNDLSLNRETYFQKIGYGLLNPGSTPTSISVYDPYTGYVYNTSFSEFIKNVTQNEIGNMNFNDQAIRAQAMAVKMAGWWAKVAHYRDEVNADIKRGDVTYIWGTSANSTVSRVCNSISNNKMFSDSDKLFYSAYIAGSSNWGGKNTGKLWQYGANFLATKQGYNWSQILHYYYDYSSQNNPNVGRVKIY